MTAQPNNTDSNDEEFITRLYNCPSCKRTHRVKLPKNLAQYKVIFPFPYIYLHSSQENLKDLLTLLYLDEEMHIRHVDVMPLENSNIFSEEHAKEISEKLMDQIVRLEKENIRLKDLLEKEKIDNAQKVEDIYLTRIKSKTPSQRGASKGKKIPLSFISTIGPSNKRSSRPFC